jgi:hypothetical protein
MGHETHSPGYLHQLPVPASPLTGPVISEVIQPLVAFELHHGED